MPEGGSAPTGSDGQKGAEVRSHERYCIQAWPAGAAQAQVGNDDSGALRAGVVGSGPGLVSR